MNTIFIGIAGGTGSGKTTLTEHLAARFGSDISVVHHDNYYKRQDRPFAERCLQNYDHPDAFDTDLMIEDLKALKRGETIHCPVYDYAIHNRTDESVPDHREAHARAVRRAHAEVCGHHRAGGRTQPGGAGYDHAAHRRTYQGELT